MTYPKRISPLMQSKIDQGALSVEKQFLPSALEKKIHPLELSDPIGDHPHSPVRGLVHRHQDRCLLKPVAVCAVYCRFCFRKEMIGPGHKALSPEELKACFDYIRETPSIWEVILTGGDPFMLKPTSLKLILNELQQIDSVKVIRIHTRIPIVAPEKLTEEFLDCFKIDKTIYVGIHMNHPDEFSPEAKAALKKLIKLGIPLVSQTVLLKGINDDAETLKELYRLMVENRVKPYYLHHPDLVKGTSHFRVTLQKGQEIMKDLQRLSGLCQPNYMLDLPGGYGKVRVDPVRFESAEGGYHIMDCEGQDHFYPEEALFQDFEG